MKKIVFQMLVIVALIGLILLYSYNNVNIVTKPISTISSEILSCSEVKCKKDDNDLCVYHNFNDMTLVKSKNMTSKFFVCKTKSGKNWHRIVVHSKNPQKSFSTTFLQKTHQESIFRFDVVTDSGSLNYISYPIDEIPNSKIILYGIYNDRYKKVSYKNFIVGTREIITSTNMNGVIETYSEDNESYQFTLNFTPIVCFQETKDILVIKNDIEHPKKIIKAKAKVVYKGQNILFAYIKKGVLHYAKINPDKN